MQELPQIVIVEDNPMYREILVQYFTKLGKYEVLSFSNGEACIAQLHKKPTAYLLDQELTPSQKEGMNGLELLQVLRSKGLGAPALFLTEHANVQPAAEIMKGGAFDYMRKEYSDLSLVSARIQQMVTWQVTETRIGQLRERGSALRRRTIFLAGLFLALLGASLAFA